MDSQHQKKRLIDIKKQLGLDRSEAYTVYTFTKGEAAVKPHATSAFRLHPLSSTPKRSNLSRTRSVFLPHSNFSLMENSNKPPVPSPKPRRTPPKPPPPYKAGNSANTSTETPLLTPPTSADAIKKVPPKPKPRTFPSSKSQSFERSSGSSSPGNSSPVPKLKTSYCSSEENLFSSIDSRPRLGTPTKLDSTGSDNIHQPTTPEPKTGQSLVVDNDGMAQVTSNFRPAAYCVVDLDNNEGSSKIVESTDIPPGGQGVTNTDTVTTDTTLCTTVHVDSTDAEYNTTVHNKTSKTSLDGTRYSSFDRPNRPPNLRSRLPGYDEISINDDTQRPLIVTRTAGYATLGSTTSNDRVLPPRNYPSPKPPRPDPPRKPANIPPPNRKSTGSSREQSPSSPGFSPARRKNPPPIASSPSHKFNGFGSKENVKENLVQKENLLQKENQILKNNQTQNENGNTSISLSTETEAETRHQDFCEIDISAILARAKSDNLPHLEDSDDNENKENESSPVTSPQKKSETLFDESMVKLDQVFDKSLLPQKTSTSHMYESLPWDTATPTTTAPPTTIATPTNLDTTPTSDKPTPKSGRRRPPPAPPSAIRSGSPTLPQRDKIPEDPKKALTLGRKPRHLKVMPTKSIEEEDDIQDFKAVLPSSNLPPPPPPPTVNKSSSDSPSTNKPRKGFWKRGFSRDESGLRSSKKNKKKSAQFLTTSISTESKSCTLPARPRGRSVDPYMSSSIYSTIETSMDQSQAFRDERSPSPSHQAFAYSVIDAKDVTLRSKPMGMKGSSFRRSQSVEHIYEFGRSLDSMSSALVKGKSPSSFDDSSVGSYLQIDCDMGGQHPEGDSPIDEGRTSTSPIRNVPHISVGNGQVYAVVSKQPRKEPVGNGKVPLLPPFQSDGSPSPPPLPPSRFLSGKTPPPKPPPYKQTDDLTNDSNKQQLNEQKDSKNRNKFIRSHTYDTVDLDTPGGGVDSPTSLRSLKAGKVRTLKPKDKPAPLPPTLENSSSCANSPNISKQNSISESSDGHSRLSTSTSDGTISTTGYYDSDSSEFEPSSDEEDDDDPNKSSTQSQLRKSKTYYIAEEILTTERTFVRGLTLLHHDFRSHMLSSNTVHDKVVISEEALNQILSSNLGGIHQLNSELLKELEDRLKNWESKPKLGDIFVGRAPFLKLYSPYISNFDKALKTLEEYGKKNQLFTQILKDFEVQPKCNNLTVAAYLLETVQRIPRYKLLLADYIKHLPPDSDDREDSEKAYEIIASVASHVNDTIKQIENFRKIIEVSKRLIGDVGDSLISPHRKLLKEGELTKSSRKEKQVRMFFLFTDLLVYASAIPPANTTFRVIKRIPLDGMKIQELDDPEMKYSFQIISTCKSFRLEANTQEERDSWMKAFEGAVKDHINRIQSRRLHRRSMMLPDSIDGVQDGNSNEGTLGLFAPPWLPDSSVSMCQLCGIHFTVTRRRHHCRACGMIFCGDCSGYMAPLPYKNNKPCRVCQTCCTTLTEVDNNNGSSTPDQSLSKPMSLKGKSKRLSTKKISMPSVLREIRARDDSAHISGYLFYRKDKGKQWKKKWFVVYNLVMYEFKRHEDVTAKKSIPLPSYSVSRVVQGLNDPLVFSLEHSGAGRIVFKADDEDQLERWVFVLEKAVKGEMDDYPMSP